MALKIVVLVSACVLCVHVSSAFSNSARFYRNTRNTTNNSTDEQAGNLRLTFENKDEIPSAFFDAPQQSENAKLSSSNHEARRISYSTCQDGSGGVCVTAGQCPSHLKATKPNPNACKISQECCFGVPESDTSCKSRGGECASTASCGNAPKVRGTECNESNGQVCCVYV